MSVISIAFTLFLIMNSLGIVPAVLAMLKNVDQKRHSQVLLREMCFALIIILLFNFLGEVFFDWLHINESSIQMAGGLVLFLIAIKMIFPSIRKSEETVEDSDPFIVPIAIPLIAGPALLATVMFYAHEESNVFVMLAAIFIAWAASTAILMAAPFLKRTFGDRGLNAFERLMGLILTLISVQMFLQGLETFLNASFPK